VSRQTAQMEDVFSEEGQSASTNAVGEALLDLVDEHEDVVVVSADLGAVVASLRDKHPEKYVELGIAETNAVSVAAGMASCGLRPYVLGYAPFTMIKCAEQIRTDLAATRMPVRLVTRLSGLAMGYFGTSHHAVHDLAIARSITNMTVTIAADNNAIRGLMASTFDVPGPVLIRITEGVDPVYDGVPTFVPGRFHPVRPGTDLTIFATGAGLSCAVVAARDLHDRGVDAAVWDAAYLKPLDEETILAAASETGAILTVEEHCETGGLGAAVAEVLGRHGRTPKFDVLALPDAELEVGTPAALLEHYGITAAGVLSRALRLVDAR